MSLPANAGINVGTVQIFPIADLGLAATVASGAGDSSHVFHVGVPCSMVVLSKLTSGTGTLNIDTADSAADIDYGSPTGTLACSGTSLQVVVVDAVAGSLYVGVQQKSTTATTVWAQLAILVNYKIDSKVDFTSKKKVINAVANTSGTLTGDGRITLTIA